MKVSLNTVKQYINFDLPPIDELVKRINEQLGGVEEVIDLDAKYKDAVIVKVIEAEQHPNADRLKVTKIDDGDVVQDVPRDENGYVQVVCGAPNARAGMFAVWLPPHSTVPATWDDVEPFVLAARELRGVLSQGMLAAADELAIGSDHEGIIEINPDEWRPSDVAIAPGTNFAEAYGLNDTIIDIENKMFTHRPDLFGQLGVAREIAGILGHAFTSPDWYKVLPKFNRGEGLELTVEHNAYEKAPRFMAVAIKGIEVKPSPLWLQCSLVAMGGKPINNIVDVTNYIMLLTSQPTHAYDYDKLRGHKLGVRMAARGEKATLLNGKTYELEESDIVIADGEGVVGLAGIMGGAGSEVSASTKNIVLEVGSFDMYTVRRSSMHHGVFTDALTRFNKGQSPLQNDYVLRLLMESIFDVSSGEQASDVCDSGAQDGREAVTAASDFVNARLGLQLNDQEIVTLLENVEINIDASDDHGRYFEVHAPFWRTDIEIPEDVVEEVGRLYGFDKLPRELPRRSMKPAVKNENRELKQSIRESLSKAGANEVLTYSFVHEKVLRNARQDPTQAFRLSNALSPDLQYYRLSVLPSLLDKVNMNIKAGHDQFMLFEIGKAHIKGKNDDEGLPKEFERIASVFAAKKSDETAYFVLKKHLDTLLSDLGIAHNVRYETLSQEEDDSAAGPFEPSRSANIFVNEKLIGRIGEFKLSVQRSFKLPEKSAGFELGIEPIAAIEKERSYRPLSKFPSVTQDISLKVATNISYADLFDVVQSALIEATEEFDIQLSPASIYQSEAESESKTITLRVQVASHDRTLRDSDVNVLLDAATERARQALGAVRA